MNNEGERLNQLPSVLKEMPGQLSAVIDGAVFEDLPDILRQRSLASFSLFRDHPDSEVERAGPWLVPIGDTRSMDAIVDIIAESSQAVGVFWCAKATEQEMLHHLRTINMALLPGGDGHEAVMFRHWDPNVLAIVLEILDKEQLSEFLGPADAVVFDAPDFGGIFRCVAGNLAERERYG